MLLCISDSFSQVNKRVKGLVTDSTRTAVSDANVLLISGSDTLRTTTDADGYFNFSKLKSESFSLEISLMGYLTHSNTYSFGKEKQLEIKNIELKYAKNMLKTVEIKGKPNPIRVMQDTIEYNAAAYQVLEGDNVADLMKQFPGLEIDANYNVKTMGKEMVKLRVNGKDFFTNDIKDFIGKLPAEIVSKIQIIDDYGDEANFTGLKIGEPIKMLNIVTKPGMNKGKFGNASLNAGTNQNFSTNSTISLWSDNKQSMGDIGFNTSYNGAGTSENSRVSFTHRDKVGKYGSLRGTYAYNASNSAFENEQAVETINPLGVFYTNTQSNGENKNNVHNINSNFDYNNKKIYMTSSFGLNYVKGSNLGSSFNNQSGVIRQDLKNNNISKRETPRINMGINLSKILKNKKNSFSVNMGFSTNAENANQKISTNTLYYDNTTQVLKKDSLLSRNLLTENSSETFNFGGNFSLGLKKLKDSLARQSLNFSYSASIGSSRNEVSTFVFNNKTNIAAFVDSLSTSYTSVIINQSLGINYNYSNKKMRYNLGLNVRPSLMNNNYINLNRRIRNNNLNYSPNINLSRTYSKGKTLSVNYTGSNNAPSINQLEPIRNTQNLQNIVIGNPNLKPFFRHSLNTNFNYVNTKSGVSLQSGLNMSTTQNEIVTNVILVPDTLNSLKQETRFENTNGTYTAGSNYSLNIPLKKNKFSISYGGGAGLSNRAIFINNTKRFNKGFNITQQVRGGVTLKKFSLFANTNYTFSSNTNMLNSGSINDIYYLNLGQVGGATFFNTHTYRADLNGSLRLTKLQITSSFNYNVTNSDAEFNSNSIRNVKNLGFSLSTRVTIMKSLFLGVNASKTINKGYSLANVNPLIVNANLTKSFLKNKRLNLNINANDLLDQGNNLSRYVSGNSIIDNRTNQVTRFFTFGLSYNLSSFGGRNIRVDAD